MIRRLLRLLFASALLLPAQKIAIEGETVYTGSAKGKLTNGVVLIDDGKIVATGSGLKIPSGYERRRAKFVTPGLLDAHTTIGLSGLYNVPADQDQDEESDPNQAELRALDGFNPGEALVDFALKNGVTTIQVAPGRKNVIAGQAAIFHSGAPRRTAESMALKPVSAMFFTLGDSPKQTYGPKNKMPTTRMGTAALIRKAFEAAGRYDGKKERDLKLEALAKVLRGEMPAVFTAHREDDILTALRIGKEFRLKIILDGGADAYLVVNELKSAGVPVIVGPVAMRNLTFETQNATLENAAILANAGIPIAIQSGFEGYVPKTRISLFEAGIAAANGLGLERALSAITIDAARILGISDRAGSLEEGKQADVVLYSGDPFEYTTRVEGVIAGGKPVSRK